MSASGSTDAEVLVLGAGPAGIGAALALGDRALVLEASPEVGGLARTIELAGAVFDLGGHSFHTPHAHVRDLVFGALEMEERTRDAWCLVGGEWLRYPFQKHFAALSDARLVEGCRAGLARRGAVDDAADFDAYLEARFGAGIAAAFMRPYNRKLWGGDLRRLAVDWVGERVAAPTGVVERAAAEGERRPLRDDTTVAYPAQGGYGAILTALARRIECLELGVAVTAIDPVARTVTTGAGRRYGFRELISTLPLPRLLGLMPGVPAPLRAAVNRLEAVPIALALVTLDGPLSTARQRVYVPDDAILGHKVVLNHNSSTSLAARPRHGIQVEISAASRAGVDDDTLVRRIVAGLSAAGLIEPSRRVVATRVVTLAQGYPAPTHERPAIVGAARRWLAERGIHTLGRFGEWAYINADEALHRGLAWAGAARAAA